MEHFDPIKVEKYIKKHPKIKNDILYILNNAMYFTKEQMISHTRELVSLWLKERDPSVQIYILFDTTKVSSGHWLYSNYKDLLEGLNVTCVFEENHIDMVENKKCEIVIIEDWDISGQHMFETIECFLRYNSCKNSTFLGIFVCSSLRGLKWCQDSYFNSTKYRSKLKKYPKDIPRVGETCYLSQYFPKERLQVITRYILKNESSNLSQSYFKKRVSDRDELFLVHSEYKIPESFSAYNMMRKCREKPDRTFMKKIQDEFSHIIYM